MCLLKLSRNGRNTNETPLENHTDHDPHLPSSNNLQCPLLLHQSNPTYSLPPSYTCIYILYPPTLLIYPKSSYITDLPLFKTHNQNTKKTKFFCLFDLPHCVKALLSKHNNFSNTRLFLSVTDTLSICTIQPQV